MSAFVEALGILADPVLIAAILVSAAYGLVVGAIPGLSATMAIALMVPITFFMDPAPAIGAVVTASAMAVFAGDLPATLLRIPGTPGSAAYTEEAYAMTRKGEAGRALSISLIGSVLGGLFGSAVLVLVAPFLAQFALSFSSIEYFWLGCLGLSCAAVVAGDSRLKGFISLLIGMFLATIGLDVIAGQPRFTFGLVEFSGGIGIIPVMIGMFAIPELIRGATSRQTDRRDGVAVSFAGSFRQALSDIWRYRIGALRGMCSGTLVGALPGAGAGTAAWISMAISRRLSREPEKFGTGHPEGLIEASASNNSAMSGAWVPALVFGIPGDPVTAIAIGVLFMKGMTPGPQVFIHSQALIYALFMIFFIANLLMLAYGWAAIRASGYILRVPTRYISPVILLFCIVGAFAINNSTLAIVVLVGAGLLGLAMESARIPIAPAILGLVLGDVVERNFLISMMKSQGDLVVFFSRPLAAVLGATTLTIWLAPVAWRFLRKLSKNPKDKANA